MATRAQRWRGPRRPDVAELRSTVQGSQSARVPHTLEPLDATQLQQQYHSEEKQQEMPSTRRRVRMEEPAAAVPHHKFGFLSAGRPAPAQPGSSSAASASASSTGVLDGEIPLSFVNRRSNIMDATRSFEDAVPLSAAEKTARAVTVANREYQAAGQGGDIFAQ